MLEMTFLSALEHFLCILPPCSTRRLCLWSWSEPSSRAYACYRTE